MDERHGDWYAHLLNFLDRIDEKKIRWEALRVSPSARIRLFVPPPVLVCDGQVIRRKKNGEVAWADVEFRPNGTIWVRRLPQPAPNRRSRECVETLSPTCRELEEILARVNRPG